MNYGISMASIRPLALILAIAIGIEATFAQGGPSIRTDFWTTDGPVYSMLESEGTLYVGGSFLSAGPNTGGAVPISANNAAVQASFPRVNGIVYSIIPDGAGGWFLGGDFDSVGGQARKGLARILPDFSLDPGWICNIAGAERPAVRNLLLSSGTLFLGGQFGSVNGISRSGLAAVRASSAEVLGWNPGVQGNILTMAEEGGVVHLGGEFMAVGGQARTNLAAVAYPSGNVLPWNPGASDPVRALAILGTNIFVGGSFSNLGGVNRTAIGLVDRTVGRTLNWSAPLNFFNTARGQAVIRSILVPPSSDFIYVGGAFSMFGGRGPRNGIAALAISNAVPTTWSPGFNSNVPAEIHAMALSDQGLVVSGSFTNIGRGTNYNLAILDTQTAAAKTNWFINAVSDSVYALSAQGGSIYAGGSFSTLGGETRQNLAAFDLASGRLKSWKPSSDGRVLAMAKIGGAIYVGGEFRNINRRTRANLAALDPVTGELNDFNVSVTGSIQTMASREGTLYIGGAFSTVAGVPRNRLAAISTESATLSEWNPDVRGATSPFVSSLIVRDNVVYLGGSFSTVAGVTRNNLAAVDVFTSRVNSWNPGADGAVNVMVFSGDTAYIGGLFTRVGVQNRSGVAAIQIGSGKPTAWNPTSEGSVGAIAVGANEAFLGGTFTSLREVPRVSLGSADLTGGAVSGWTPDPFGFLQPSVNSLSVVGENLFVGGNFLRLSDYSVRGLVAYKISGGPIVSRPSLTGIQLGVDGRISFSIRPFSTSAKVEYSANLQDWVPAAGVVDAAGTYSEAATSGTSKFFRVRVP